MSDGAVLSFFTPRPDGEPVVLRGEHPVTVTKEEQHQAVLARHLAADGRARQMAVELGFCRIAEGKYRGGRAIEVRIDAERVGELTARMSERYAPLVEAVLTARQRPMCEAVVTSGSRGAQIELRLPAPDALPTSPPPPPPQMPSAAWTTVSPTGPDGWSLPTAPTTALPMTRPTWEQPGATRASADGLRGTRSSWPPRGKTGVATRYIDGGSMTGSHRRPMGDPAGRRPDQRKSRKRKVALWGVGAFLGLAFLGSLGDDEPATPPAGPAAVSSATATTSAQPAPTTTSAATTTTTSVPTSTGGARAGAGAGAGAGVNGPDRQRTTTRRAPTTTTPPARTRDQPASVSYKNCAAVQAAGAAPIRRGDPGYGRHLDRDGDGVGCAGD